MRIIIDTSEIRLSLAQELEDNLQLAKDQADKIALDFHRGVKRRTPVKTGAARNAWDVDTNSDTPTIENNIEYIGALNRGHSSQAPAGFIEAELDAATRRNLRR